MTWAHAVLVALLLQNLKGQHINVGKEETRKCGGTIKLEVFCSAAWAASPAPDDNGLQEWDAEQSTGMSLGSGLTFEEWYKAKTPALGEPVSRRVDELGAWRQDPQPPFQAERVRGTPDGMPAVIVKSVLSPEECTALIDGFPSEGGAGYMNSSQVAALYRDRAVKARILSNDTRLASILLDRLRPYIPASLDGGKLLRLAPAFRFVHYDKGGHQAAHVDGREPGDPKLEKELGGWVQSRLTVQVYLNTHGKDFAGGGLSFQDVTGNSKHHIVPDGGDVVIFYQERLHPASEYPPIELHHTAYDVEWGEKYICRTMVDYLFPTEDRAVLGNLKDDAAAAAAIAKEKHASTRPTAVLAIGNTIIDNIMTVQNVPVDSKAFVDSKKQYVGGQGSNAVLGMAMLGANVSFITRLGDDDEGHMAGRTYRSEGLDLSLSKALIETRPAAARTMSAVVVVETSTMQRTILMHRDENLFADATPAISAASAALRAGQFDVVYTDGHQLDLALPIVRAAADAGIPIVADIESLEDERFADLAMLATDVIMPLSIGKVLVNKDTPRDVVSALASAYNYSKVVIATDGPQGSYWLDHSTDSCDAEPEFVHTAAWKTNAVDTTGAGDAFHGGYLVARYVHKSPLRQAVDFATRVAAASTETPGPVVGREALARFGVALPA